MVQRQKSIDITLETISGLRFEIGGENQLLEFYPPSGIMV